MVYVDSNDVIAGNLANVNNALAQGADPNALGVDNIRLIQLAAMANQPAIFATLVQHGANPTVYDEHHSQPLFYAARAGASQAFIKQIIQAGCDVNNQQDTGLTPLHIAARLGNVDALQGLLKNGANPNIKNITGGTPLFDAVSMDQPAVILSLKEFGASSTIADNHAVTPLSAAETSTDKLIKGIFEFPILERMQVGNNALLQAVATDQIADIQSALANGANPNTVNQYGMSTMQYAAIHGYSDAITLLKAHGADIIYTNTSGMQAIHMAAMNHQADALATLLGMGAAIEATDYQGNTPLHYAAAYIDDTTFIQKLLDAGADINAVNNFGQTPLYFAAEDDNLATVEFLVQHNANTATVDVQGDTALQEAVKMHNTDVVNFLSQHTADNAQHSTMLDQKSMAQSTITLSDVISSEDALSVLHNASNQQALAQAEAAPSYSVYVQAVEAPVHVVDAIL